MRRVFAVVVFLLVVSCTLPQSPAQAVYAIQGNYAAALTIAVAYTKLPDCTAGGPQVCKLPSVVSAVRKADDVAWNAIKAAQDTVRTPGISDSSITAALVSAENAVRALVAITQALKVS